MLPQNARTRFASRPGRSQGGFSLLELIIAMVVLMVGIVAVVQLVPASLQSNLSNRVDTTATVIIQRELDQMMIQPLSSSFFTDQDRRRINLGNSALPNIVVGGPVIADGNSARIDFSAAPVAGYSLTPPYNDRNDPTGSRYDVRWAVICTVNNGVVVSKRIIIGCRRLNAAQPGLSSNLDTVIQKF